jgi:hypothetical protein
MPRNHRILALLSWTGLLLAGGGLVWTLTPPRGIDVDYFPLVRLPAYKGRGPRVLIDEAHGNTHTAKGAYRPLVRLLEHDGYRVSRNRQRLVPELLETFDVLVSANPVDLAESELAAVYAWVEQGGALLLAGRPPARLAEQVGNMHRLDDFDHPILRGRTDRDDGVGRVVGAAPRIAAVGVGKGRLVVFSDPDALTARIVAGGKVGLNSPNGDNARLALNIFHWLSRSVRPESDDRAVRRPSP